MKLEFLTAHHNLFQNMTFGGKIKCFFFIDYITLYETPYIIRC